MLYQELPRIESTPLDGWGRWLAPALIFAAALGVIQCQIVDPHRDKAISQGCIHVAGKLHCVLESVLPVS